MEKSTNRKRLLLYLALTFALTWMYEVLIVIPLVRDPAAAHTNYATPLMAVAMLFPSICAVLTRLITKEGFTDSWIRLNFKRRWKYYVFAWFSPAVLTAIGCVVYFAINPSHYDSEWGYFRQILLTAAPTYTEAQIAAAINAQLVQAVLLAPLLNVVFCFGEEFGWRGYMLPKMLGSGIKIIPTLLLGGVVWGLWHAPLTWGVGHNYGSGYEGFPWLGILAMCGFCILLGTLFSFVTLRTRSCIPAALAHGGINGIASFGVYLMLSPEKNYNPFVGPAPTGYIGGAAFAVTAVVLTLLLARDEKRGALIYSPPVETEDIQMPESAEPSQMAIDGKDGD
ncbi:MAG: type II CAAX endopeptidase family protein [Oscillospiraceae bacterium]